MTIGDPLQQALSDTGDLAVRPLPEHAARLLRDLQVPPRLAVHLRLVHDVAYELLDWVQDRYPAVVLDREAVLFGAATHDIGKTIHVDELSQPGSRHEEAGRALLLSRGVPARLARFAGTHASWTGPVADPQAGPGAELEDRLVSLADKIWKNKRVPDLENLIVARLAAVSGEPDWEVFLALDDLLTSIGDAAAQRLAFQASYPTTKP